LTIGNCCRTDLDDRLHSENVQDSSSFPPSNKCVCKFVDQKKLPFAGYSVVKERPRTQPPSRNSSKVAHRAVTCCEIVCLRTFRRWPAQPKL